MKLYLLLPIISFITTTISAQETNYDFGTKIEVKKQEKHVESPYAMFGDNTAVLQTKHENEKNHILKIPIVNNEKQEVVFKLDFQTGIVSIHDNEENILSRKQLEKESSARFISIDPMAEKYYSISPYAYVANNPINSIDLRGDTITTVIDGNSYTWGITNGTYGFVDSSGALYSGTNAYALDLTNALNILRTGNVGKALVDYLAGDSGNMSIRAPRPNSNERNSAFGSSGVIWDSNSTSVAGMNRPSFVGLGHELAHVQDSWAGTINNSTWIILEGTKVRKSEQYATFMENQIRQEHNLSLRTHYAYDVSSGSAVGIPSTSLLNSNGTSRFYQGMSTTITIMNGLPIYITAPYKRRH